MEEDMRKSVVMAMALMAMTAPVIAKDGVTMRQAPNNALPSLVGDWTGTSESVVLGSGAHHPGSETLQDAPCMREVEFTFSVQGQDGHRFWGVIKSPDFSEPFVAVFSRDNKNAYGADTDGIYHFTLASADEMELCYAHPATSPTGSIVAACNVLTAGEEVDWSRQYPCLLGHART
jgi:hypothetical protein